MTFAERGNAKPFGKQLSPSAEMLNLSGNDFRRARPLQNSSYNLSFLNIFVSLWYETEVILSQFC